MSLEIPDDMVVALQLTPDQLREELLVAAAVKFFELGRLSSGATVPLADFLDDFPSVSREQAVAALEQGHGHGP